MVLTSEWSQVEVVDLTNDGNGLGFMLVGGKSTGVVIKALLPGGLAERDGRLQSGDHVIQIGDVSLRGFSSEQVATVLRQCGAQVRLVVARPIDPSLVEYHALSNTAPIVPTKLLTDPECDRTLLQTSAYAPANAYATATQQQQQQSEVVSVVTQEIVPIEIVAMNNAINVENHGQIILSPILDVNAAAAAAVVVNTNATPAETPTTEHEEEYLKLPETQTYEVELRKNVYGLGITVAGYVCEEEGLSGIFVKSIIEGSAADMSRQIQINDRIVAVDGISLNGVTNHQAVEILRNTDICVKLKLERFLRGRKFEHLQVALDQKGDASLPPSPSITTLSICAANSDSIITEGYIDPEIVSCTTIDSNIFGLLQENPTQDNGNQVKTPTIEIAEIISAPSDPDFKKWSNKIGNHAEIVTCEVNKLAGLGISLEGTVDVEHGVEVRPHHYIRSILAEGPIGKTGKLKPGDELLQVNDHMLQGLQHTEVVKILRDLPSQVKVVCCRGVSAPHVIDTSTDIEAFETRSILPKECLRGMLTRAQSESSLYTSSTATLTEQRSKSVEQVSGLALWNNEVMYVDIEKTDKGFGFSILDYQDPLDPDGTVIVVRGLIPGGSAETSNSIFPGDRLVSVNDHNLNSASLDEAVTILKAIPSGLARIGLCRPLSMSDISSPAETPT